MNRRNPMAPALLVAVALGCQPRSSETSPVTPSAAEGAASPEAAGPHEGESSKELEARLGRLRERQRSLVPTATGDQAVCEEVCSLATSICGVKAKLCNIADEHAQDEEFQRLCRGAKAECRKAQEACVQCVEHHRSQ